MAVGQVTDPAPMCAGEDAVRRRLGVPSSATEVVVVAESTHWDPNWLLSSRQYYRLCVRPTLDRVLNELRAQPRRVFSVECLFFVDLYWRDRAERRDEIRALVNEGRLRLSGCGVTTPDTLLPEDELLLRDLLAGQEWLRERRMTQEPRLLYLPDSFGHTPALPSVLHAAGIEHAAVCRIDGMRFPGADLEAAANFPRAGSSAAALIDAGTADFVWRGGDGGEVLTHWMAHGYGHGDMIASGGVSRVMGLPVSWPDRRIRSIDRKVDRYLAALRPLARTPYRLLAIGFDFVRPVPKLVELLDDWNERHHEATGTWLVNAGIDDYLDLVAVRRSQLPTIAFDPNPYWMGFYATRPAIKDQARDLGRRLIATDAARAEAALAGEAVQLDDASATRSWWTAVTANHHDFVTGTAPDRVARGEQARWLHAALADAPWPAPSARCVRDAPDRGCRPSPLRVAQSGSTVTVEAGWGTAAFDAARGGALVDLRDERGMALLGGPSLVLVSYFDSGGLWRMGQELNGGRWVRVDGSIERQAPIDVDVDPDGGRAWVTVRATLEGRTAMLRHVLRADRPGIVTHTRLQARARRTVTLATRQPRPASAMTMHQPGGVVDRPLRRWYDPTYWPLHSFAAVIDASSGEPVPASVVAAATPTGVHADPDGSLEVVVARTAVKEIAFRVVPVMAPAWGRRWPHQSAVLAHRWHVNAPAGAAVALGRDLTDLVDQAAGRPRAAMPVTVADPEVEVTAVKPAHRGPGVIVRLRDWSHGSAGRLVDLRLAPAVGRVAAAHLADSRERDIAPLRIAGDAVQVPIAGHLTTVRIQRT